MLSFPVAYFTGYHPEISYLKDEDNRVISEPFALHDINILRLYLSGKSVSDAAQAIKDESFYSNEFLESNLDSTLKNLEKREANLDIKLSPFIKKTFRDSQLFHSFNHPSSDILGYVFSSVLDLVAVAREKEFSELFWNSDVLAQSSFPVYQSVSRGLELEFSTTTDYRMNKQTLTRKEVVEAYFKFYSENHEKVTALATSMAVNN